MLFHYFMAVTSILKVEQIEMKRSNWLVFGKKGKLRIIFTLKVKVTGC